MEIRKCLKTPELNKCPRYTIGAPSKNVLTNRQIIYCNNTY